MKAASASALFILLASCSSEPTTPSMGAPAPDFTIGGGAPTTVLAGPIVNPANGHSYYLLTQDTWSNSEAFATRLGGHLVTINDQAENDWVFGTFSSYGRVPRSLWIGFTDRSAEGVFVWVDGENSRYTNWSAGQPNNGITASRGPESFAHLWSPDFIAAYGFPQGSWNDYVDEVLVDGMSPLHGVVEIGAPTNLAPVVSGILLPGSPIAVETPVEFAAAFTDANPTDLHTSTVSWGDGTASSGQVSESNGAGTVTGHHAYLTPGVYTLEVTVSDGSLSGTRSSALDTPSYVVVYDPSAGFVTGGGWITSPSGAYAANPALTGKANFGFVSMYQRGAQIPTGNTEFQFHAAELDFTSSSYQWLVVAGAKAQFKGAGTINGAGDFGFLLSAVDGQVTGGGGTDRFRIKIWDLVTGGVVYDNQQGAGDGEAAVTALGGGSIAIHP